MTARVRHDSDDGITLVELLVTVFVGGLILSLIGTIFVTTLQANAATRDRDLATGRAQAISTALTTSIRNAAAVQQDGTVVRALVATGDAGWECRAWAVVDLETTDAAGRRAGADGRPEFRVTTYAPLGPAATAPSPATGWGALAERIEHAEDATGADIPVFTLADGRLSWALTVVVSEQPSVSARSSATITGTATALAQTEEAVRCW
ncbi:hypothetical protein QSU92_10070 [Microbacterium sp. ET2]|uniref:PulJ/GspJ family protein n=1 Tax=Microbacterium albipurpureum TaxID=3050384 RepID=UPI00259CCEF3|nr:hypothetical protein [Microbacterium sp. ET2 (Ac-2212)]WJL94336.1 hypothetical protein QSU92_10070 [Microbacterium sp. ET2 (Ac-2212)]